MKNLNYLNTYRISVMGSIGDEYNGMFEIKIKGEKYKIIASNGDEWEHVSISHKHKIPSWSVMCELKDLFFEPGETVMQLHVPPEDHINIHPNCLHLWRPIKKEIPRPPKYMIG